MAAEQRGGVASREHLGLRLGETDRRQCGGTSGRNGTSASDSDSASASGASSGDAIMTVVAAADVVAAIPFIRGRVVVTGR